MADSTTHKALVLPAKIVETAERKRIAESEEYGYEAPAPILNAFNITNRHLANSAKLGSFFPTVERDDPDPANLYRGMSGPEILRHMVEKADAEGRAYPWGR
jgi:hypothetical protein